jgi:hypothetical protein
LIKRYVGSGSGFSLRVGFIGFFFLVNHQTISSPPKFPNPLAEPEKQVIRTDILVPAIAIKHEAAGTYKPEITPIHHGVTASEFMHARHPTRCESVEPKSPSHWSVHHSWDDLQIPAESRMNA